MPRLTWEAIRKSLGIPEPEPVASRGEDRGSRREAGGVGEKGLDTEVAPDMVPDIRGENPDAAPAGMVADDQHVLDGGVSVSPTPIGAGQRVTVTYEGMLANQGAQGIYLHYGYGPGNWRDVQEAAMRPVGPRRFQAFIEVRDRGRLEFCFRDNGGNWDNNNGRNWSYTIRSGGSRT